MNIFSAIKKSLTKQELIIDLDALDSTIAKLYEIRLNEVDPKSENWMYLHGLIHGIEFVRMGHLRSSEDFAIEMLALRNTITNQ